MLSALCFPVGFQAMRCPLEGGCVRLQAKVQHALSLPEYALGKGDAGNLTVRRSEVRTHPSGCAPGHATAAHSAGTQRRRSWEH